MSKIFVQTLEEKCIERDLFRDESKIHCQDIIIFMVFVNGSLRVFEKVEELPRVYEGGFKPRILL